MSAYRKTGWLGTVVVAAGLASQANAAPIVMQVTGVDAARGGSIKMLVDGGVKTEYAGLINIKLDGLAAAAFCVDLFHNIGIETIQANPFSPYTTPNTNGARAAWLFANQLSMVNSVAAGEAFQLAIWDIIHDGGDGLSAGRIGASAGIGTPAGVITAANQFLAASLGQSSGAASIYVSVDGPTAKQALVSVYLGGGGGWTPPLDQGAVPEPATFALTGIGLAAAAIYVRRRRRA